MTHPLLLRRLGIIAALSTMALDQLSKFLALNMLGVLDHPMEVLPFFNFILVWNTGISFGMFAGLHEHQALVLTLLTGAISVALLVWLWRAQERLTAFALGLIIGGAAGNIIDRVRYGAVADFLDFHAFGWHWPAFNIADAGIVLGVILLCWESFIVPKH